jgi:hypothetical protein
MCTRFTTFCTSHWIEVGVGLQALNISLRNVMQNKFLLSNKCVQERVEVVSQFLYNLSQNNEHSNNKNQALSHDLLEYQA